MRLWVRRSVPGLLALAVAMGCSGRSVRHEGGEPESGSGGAGPSVGGAAGTGATGGSSGGVGGAGTGATGGVGNAGATAGGVGGAGGVINPGTGGTIAGQGGSAGGGTGNVSGGSGTGGGTNGGETGSKPCAIARRLDQCCSAPEAITREELESDDCWSEVVNYDYGETPPSACESALCMVACPRQFLPSRLAELDASGQCQFVSECNTTADCVAARDTRYCCNCGEPFPKTLVSEELCLVTALALDTYFCNACETVDCDGCTGVPEVACLVDEVSGLNTCGAPPPDGAIPSGQCGAERSCVAENSPGIHCFAPDEMSCAGPPPPPDECQSDVDCSFEENWPCEPLGHCGAKVCVLGCNSGGLDCEEWESCQGDGRCALRECDDTAPCGADHECIDGTCARRPCGTSLDCDGFCVKGLCYDTPGNCWDALAP